MKNKAETVINYYVLCNKLKYLIRTGWTDWQIDQERVESVAEHIYSVQQLAIIMWSEYEYDIDIQKVLFMLAVHELEETTIGDLTAWDISQAEKEKIGHEAVVNILKDITNGETIKELIFEFDEQQTNEAKFAYQCDKLECDLQAKMYDEANAIDINKQSINTKGDKETLKLYLNGQTTFNEYWMSYGRRTYNYDNNFNEVSEYAQENKMNQKVKVK